MGCTGKSPQDGRGDGREDGRGDGQGNGQGDGQRAEAGNPKVGQGTAVLALPSQVADPSP